MPGLYKSKRKRITLDSSCANDQSVWHSTPVDAGTLSTSTVAAPTTSANTNAEEEGDNEEGEETVISPVKRVARGDGVLRGRGIMASTQVDGNETPVSPGPSSVSVIDTAAAPVDVVIDEDADMFAEDDNENEVEECSPAQSRKEKAAEEEQRRGRRSPSLTMERETGVHLSQRFGPVQIHPPSGHGFFASILHENGFVLTLPKNVIYNDVSVFRERMQKWFIENQDENSRIEDKATKFSKALKKYFSTRNNLVHACSTTLNDAQCIQPSLLACLLGVEALQKQILEVVLPAVSEASYSNMQEDVDFVATVLTQMKWLPVVVDGKKLADDVLHILDAAGIASKKHIIRLLPEIFLPDQHPYLVPKLMEIFDEDTPINVMMLDCFSCLIIPEEDCMRIRRTAVDKMSAAALEDLPAYISFLFRVGSTQLQLEEGIREMREKLEIKPKHTKNRVNKEEALMVEILERIRFFVSVNPSISKIWLNHVKDDLSMDIELHAIDLLMLLVLLEGSSSNKAALSVLTAVFANADVTNAMFDVMMKNNNQMLHELFPTLARFLDNVIRVKNSKCHEAAADITKKLFVGLGPILSQHLMSNLIGILINGHPTCRDLVLKIFQSIAETDAPKLLHFHTYLMGSLVYVIKYPPRQMQALMNILAILAYMPETLFGEENSFTAEFMILLRKQITNGNLRIRCFGVLGTIAAVRQLMLKSAEGCEEKIDNLLALAWSSIENDEEACSIFFDEMISCVSVLPKNISIQFRNILRAQFERLWTSEHVLGTDDGNIRKGQAGLQLEPTFDGNNDMEGYRPLLVLESHALRTSPLVIPALLRVLAEFEKAACNGDLVEIDALLGCPILLPKLSMYYELHTLDDFNYTQRYHLGQYLVITLNYFRECISAFVTSENKELEIKVWMRLADIIKLQKILVKHYYSFPGLPLAYGTEKTMVEENAAGFSGALVRPGTSGGTIPKKKQLKPKTKPKGKKKNKKKRNKTADFDDDDDQADSDSNNDVINDDESESETDDRRQEDVEKRIQPKLISSHIRRLDQKIFEILMQFPLDPVCEQLDFSIVVRDISAATQSRRTMRRIERFGPETFALLLLEMKRQTLECNLDICNLSNILPNLCRQVDIITNYYSDENKGVHTATLDSCFCLLLNVVGLFFTRLSSLPKNSQEERISHAVDVLAKRLPSVAESANDDPELQNKNMATYLLNFAAAVGPGDQETALEHIKLLKIVHDLLSDKNNMKNAINEAINNYLKRCWKLRSSTISEILKTWFKVSASPLCTIRNVVEQVFTPDPADNSGVPNCTFYESCNKTNFPTWYSTVLESLAKHMFQQRRLKGNIDEAFRVWSNGNALMKILVDVSLLLKKSSILIPLLRFGRVYIEALNAGGVYLIPQLYKRDVNHGREFVKQLQYTRKIQSICEHSKIMKDNTLLRQVPPMKRSLETLVFKLRETLGSVGASGAIALANLKQKNLDGQEICSQAFTAEGHESDSESDNENEEEEAEEDNEEEVEEEDHAEEIE